MIKFFLSHSWKKFSRSVSFGKEMTTTLFLAFLGVMLVGYALALGFGLNHIIIKGLKIDDSVTFLNGLLLYYFGFEFVLRFFFQTLPVLDAQPYLHLPVKKSGIVHYLLIKSMLNVINLLPLLLFAPFAFVAIAPVYGTLAAWIWLPGIWLTGIMFHYLVILFKKELDDSIWGLIILIGLFVLFGAIDYYGWFKLSDVSAFMFTAFITQPLFILIPIALSTGVYFLCYYFFRQGMYIEGMSRQKNDLYGVTKDISFLNSFGNIGAWINLELKLILRNKRPRNIFYLSLFFLSYGLAFYTRKQYAEDMPGFLLFVSTFVTGTFMINYGQFLFSWQGGHFDFTLTQPVSIRNYVEAKYWLLCSVTIICSVLSVPYVYFGWQILAMQLAAAAFNLGINVFIILNMAMWEPKKMDLKKSTVFNYQGVGAAQWLMGFPILLGPYVFYLPFSLTGYSNVGILAVGLAGVIGIVFRKKFLAITTNRLIEKRYVIAANFRKEG
ncbi:MAG: hypothetical protein KF845_01600 [Cyclobacteriaceae bacterium]|nr:hypothetical protein [Cyclobacteriaceae bacterium]